MTSIHFSQLTQCFGTRCLFKDLALTLTSGHCLLLTGANGTGKTSLMRILAGLDKPRSALIETESGRFSWRQYRQRLQNDIMYLHQQPYLFSGSVADNLAYALPRPLSRAQKQQQIEQIAAWAGLSHLLPQVAKRLSGGESQRLAIARALLRKPKALLLDEPTASMDQAAREMTAALIQQLKDEGLMLLIASHELSLFAQVADQTLQLQALPTPATGASR